jgi:N-carbamoyl-L-amino-acid hydrolase
MADRLHIEISGERLIAELRELSTFGKSGRGVDRIAFSPPDIEARHWLRERMAAAGLNATIDAVGNVLGRAPGEGEGVLIGSHTDTVPKGGWLDGALGVMYGLEIARAILAADNAAIVDVISFQDEEGTFLPCLGSKSLCREVADEDVDQARSPAGDSLREVLARAEMPLPPPVTQLNQLKSLEKAFHIRISCHIHTHNSESACPALLV